MTPTRVSAIDWPPDKLYGCGGCGRPLEAHEGEKLACPDQPYGFVKWASNYRWVDDGHAFVVVVQGGGSTPVPKVICPDKCPEMICHCRGEEGHLDPASECETCHGTGHEPDTCYVRFMVTEFGSEVWEWTDWRHDMVFGPPLPILWYADIDEFHWRPKVTTP